MGVYGGWGGGFLGVPLINGGLHRGFTGVLGGFGGVFEGNKAPGVKSA